VQRSWGQTESSSLAGRPVARCCVSLGFRCQKIAPLIGMLARTTGLEIREGPPRLKSGNCAPVICSVVGLANRIHRSGFRSAPSPERPGVRLPPPTRRLRIRLAWGRRCEVLLSGAPLLLDSSSPGFEPELARVVLEAVEQWDHQLLENAAHPGGHARAGHHWAKFFMA